MKKLLSILITLSIITINVPVLADGNTETTQMELPVQEWIEYENEPTVEELPYVVEPSDKDEAKERSNVSLMALDSTDFTFAQWDKIFKDFLGNGYYNSYSKNESGMTIRGETNRISAEQTDLALPGKNGLDFVLKRKYDNQKYSYFYVGEKKDYWTSSYQYIYCYPFKNTKTGDTVNIGFYSEDDIYLYMYNGASFSNIPSYSLYYKDLTSGERIYFYMYDEIKGYQTTPGENTIDLVYENGGRKYFSRRFSEDSQYEFVSKKIQYEHNEIANEWYFEFPEVCMSRTDYWRDNRGSYTEYYGYYYGTFRDIYGQVHTLCQSVDLDVYTDTSKLSFSAHADYNKYLTFECYYEPKTIAGTDITYKYVVHDNQHGIHYYFDLDELVVKEQLMRIKAVANNYGDIISYSYINSETGLAGNRITKITDTYGREIYINYSESNIQVKYINENEEEKIIDYSCEVINGEIENDESCLYQKPINRLTVTNEDGEKTIYDSRNTNTSTVLDWSGYILGVHDFPTAFTNSTSMLAHSNLERIIYPSGNETRIVYEPIFKSRPEFNCVQQMYAVSSIYDIEDGEIKDRHDYTIDGTSSITVTDNNISAGSVTKNIFNNKAQLTSVTTSSNGNTTAPYQRTNYTYDEYNNPKKVTVNNNGLSSTTNYSYNHMYNSRLMSENDGLKIINYTYHSGIDAIATKTYQYIKNSAYVIDFIYETTLTEDGKKIEYERIKKDNAVVSQVKHEYNDEGYEIRTKKWISDSNNDGVLDENDEFTVTETNTVLTDGKSLDITVTASDIEDIDGTELENISETYKLDIYGNIKTKIDAYNNVTNITYDILARPLTGQYPNGATVSIEYDGLNDIKTVTNEMGATTKYLYDMAGNITEIQMYENGEWNTVEKYNYDSVRRLSEKITYTDDSTYLKTKYTYDILDRHTKYEHYDGSGDLLYTENFAYTPMGSYGKITHTIVDANNQTISTTEQLYDKYNRIYDTTISSGAQSSKTTCVYDYLDRVISVTDPNGGVTTTEYDYNGNVISVTDALGNVVTSQYDLAGRNISTTDAMGNTTTNTYDSLDRLIKSEVPFNENNALTKYYYDKNSRLKKQSDLIENGEYQSTEYVYDVMGNVLGSIAHDDNSDVVTQYEYDLLGNVTKMTTGLTAYSPTPQGGHETSYTYDLFGRLLSSTDPMGKNQTVSGYNYSGNPLSITDRNGNIASYEYGVFGIEKVSVGDEEQTTQYNGLGQITSVSSKNADGTVETESYTYDGFGRTISASSNGKIQNYSYDANSNLVGYTLNENDVTLNSINYTYDKLNRLTQMSVDDIITSYTYNANSQLTSKSVSNGLVTNYGYNKAGLIVNMVNKKGEDIYNNYSSTYTLNGLKKSEAESGVQTKTYQYDKLGRLTNEQVTNAENAIMLNNSFTYDNFGNRASMVSGNITNTYTYDANNRLLKTVKTENGIDEITSYAYDNNGNQIAWYKSTISPNGGEESYSLTDETDGTEYGYYTYDAFNRLSTYTNGVINASYTYGADNLRQSKTVDGVTTRYIWNGSNMVMETTDETVNQYYYGADGIAFADFNGTTNYYQKNAHGDITALTDANGTITRNYQFDAFGNELTNNANDINPFRYAGEYQDNETGLIYLRARMYDPETGRFITEDPIKDGLNWYVYCNNNPVMFIDSFGLATVAIRDYTNGYSGTVNWNDTWGVASFKINDNTFWVTGSGYNDEGIAVTNIDGRLYAEDSDLNNFFFGVTLKDTEAGVTITMFDGIPYIDISTPVKNALDRDVGDFIENKGKKRYFKSRVGNKGDWNLKYREPGEYHWEETLGISFWGYQTPMLLNGRPVIVEQVGNITYGYLGAAAGMSKWWMNTGSTINHIFTHPFSGWDNEAADKELFDMGINWYTQGVMR